MNPSKLTLQLTMQYAVLRHFPDARVVIKFTNRSPQMRFSRECFDWIQERVNRLEELALTPEERRRLAAACPYFPASYLDFLEGMRLHPREQVKLVFDADEDGFGRINCAIEGLWRECILYEIPIMAISERAQSECSPADISLRGILQVCRHGLDDGRAVW
jgi:nicotinate phosphoribosyltransferase